MVHVALFIVLGLCGGVRLDGSVDVDDLKTRSDACKVLEHLEISRKTNAGSLLIGVDGNMLEVDCKVKNFASKNRWRQNRESFKSSLQILLKHPPCKELVLSQVCNPKVLDAVKVEVMIPAEDKDQHLHCGYFKGKSEDNPRPLIVLDSSQTTDVMVDTLLFELFNAKFAPEMKAASAGHIPEVMKRGKKQAEIEALTSWEHLGLFESMIDEGLVALEGDPGQGKFILPEMTARQLERKKRLGDLGSFTQHFCETVHVPNALTSKGLPTAEMYAYDSIKRLSDNGLRMTFQSVVKDNVEAAGFIKEYSKKWKSLENYPGLKPAAYVNLTNILKEKLATDADLSSYEFTPNMKEVAKREEQEQAS